MERERGVLRKHSASFLGISLLAEPGLCVVFGGGLSCGKESGGRSWDRTNDLPIKSRLLYQLSYMP